jgi:hypothetical protein
MHNTPVTETFTAPLGNASEVYLPLPNWSSMREAEGSCTICYSSAGTCTILCTYFFLQCFPRIFLFTYSREPVNSVVSKILMSGGGIQERTVGLRFLGIISRVLRLEVSTLVLCLSTRCSS